MQVEAYILLLSYKVRFMNGDYLFCHKKSLQKKNIHYICGGVNEYLTRS